MLDEGASAPDFTADSTQGKIRLSDLWQTGPLVLYFFPKADTPG